MATDVAKLFTSLGLSSLETRLYLASLDLGPTSVQEIAKKAGISRTAAYQAIEALQGRGLLSTFEKGKKTMYRAEDPESAVGLFKARLVRMQEEIGMLEKAVPELKLKAHGERPVVRFYEGDEAIRALFNDVALVKPPFMYEVANYDDIYAYLDANTWLEARTLLDPKKTKVRLLHRGTPRNPKSGVEFCPLLEELGEFHGDIWIYENHVAFVTFVGKPVTIIIESKPFFDTAKVLFEAAWRICKR